MPELFVIVVGILVGLNAWQGSPWAFVKLLPLVPGYCAARLTVRAVRTRRVVRVVRARGIPRWWRSVQAASWRKRACYGALVAMFAFVSVAMTLEVFSPSTGETGWRDAVTTAAALMFGWLLLLALGISGWDGLTRLIRSLRKQEGAPRQGHRRT